MIDQAQVVIIGGGIVGCSMAYHLTHMGIKDVLLLEKGELTSGSTWHAAGLVGQLRSNRNVTRMLKYSVELYDRLEKETGQATEWKKIGGLRLACSSDRMIELKKQATTAKSFGMEMHIISPKEAQKLFPIMDIKNLEGAAYIPSDGAIEPSSVTHALARGARNGGATILQGVTVSNIIVKNRRASTIITNKGEIKTEIVVNCAGMWAREIGQMAGVNVPLIPVEHQFLVTEPIANLPKNLPTLRDPDNLIYYKEEAGGLVMGGYEPNPKPWAINKIPRDFTQKLLNEDFDHFEQLSVPAMSRTPVLQKAQIRKLINGPEAFTTDGNPILGLAPELDNFYVAAGFNAHGIAAGGGVGQMMAEWIIEERPSLDLWSLDIRRFGDYHRNINYLVDRTCELYGKHYTMVWPNEEHQSARKIRRGPLYEVLKKNGASFGAKFAWERPNWFAPKGVKPVDINTFRRPNWFQYVAFEHKNIRENVALIDQSSFSKFQVEGPSAYKYLQWLAAGEIKEVGEITYTQLCNNDGGIECDVTIARVEEDKFYIITGTAFGTHDIDWISRNAPKDGSVIINDVTASYAVINICGPNSLKVLKKVTHEDISNQAFPFYSLKHISIGLAQVLALKITYVGEMGLELHIPTDYAQYVYEQLKMKGEEFKIIDAGYRAIESCRLEKGYRYWSSDLTPDYNPFEAGLGFCVALLSKTKGDFLGKKALQKIKEKPLTRRLICLTLENKNVELLGGETIMKDGKVLGVLTSGGYGHTIDKPIAYGYVPYLESKYHNYQVEVLGESIPAIRHKKALYDPKRERLFNLPITNIS